MRFFNELTFSAIAVDDFLNSPHLPTICDICKKSEPPFMEYKLCAPPEGIEIGSRDSGFCCKNCVSSLVLRVVQQTERNIEIAQQRPTDFDYRDAELDENGEEYALEAISQYEKDLVTLRLTAIPPAYLLFRFKGKASAHCKHCGTTPLLLYAWHGPGSNERGLLCHRCAFNFCEVVLGSSTQNEAEAEARGVENYWTP